MEIRVLCDVWQMECYTHNVADGIATCIEPAGRMADVVPPGASIVT